MRNIQRIEELVYGIYGEKPEIVDEIKALADKWGQAPPLPAWIDERDIMLITYGDGIKDNGEAPLGTLKKFADNYLRGVVSGIHLLPIYPYTSDDGFSVVDYYAIDPDLGSWQDVAALGENFDIMLDAVVNHISKSSSWFQGYLAGDNAYCNYFVEGDPSADYSSVVRPRALPLLTRFDTSEGEKYIWTTFSEDQIDLNFENPKTLLDILDVLIFYARQGARYLRLDAIGFLWKELGTSCMHLEKTHLLVQLMRAVIDATSPGTILITETNVPHEENISYLRGNKEAHMVYQFPLPPLTLYTFLSGNSIPFVNWLKNLEPAEEGTAFFNFLSSHDGIGMRPAEGLLSEEAQAFLIESCKNSGGMLNFRQMPDGSQKVYELNINYNDALAPPETPEPRRAEITLAAHALLLSIPGLPAIYYHTILGSRNDLKGLKESGINRRINREKLSYETLVKELETPGSFRQQVYNGMTKMIRARKNCKAFAPDADIVIETSDSRLITFRRINKKENAEVFCCVNVSADEVPVLIEKDGHDILQERKVEKGELVLAPYQAVWIV